MEASRKKLEKVNPSFADIQNNWPLTVDLNVVSLGDGWWDAIRGDAQISAHVCPLNAT